jgi:hypothetical protein
MLGTLKRKLGRAVRESDTYWRHIANQDPSKALKRAGLSLTSVQHDLLQQLRRDGVVITDTRTMFGESRLLEELTRAVDQKERDWQQRIEAQRAMVDGPGVKTYMLELLGERPLLDPTDVFVRFAVQPAVLNLANAYMGMYTRLNLVQVWHNLPSRGPARNAQLWHRDRDDRRMFKLFIYFTDVGLGEGPLVYAPGTHKDGTVQQDPETFGEEGTTARRSNDEQMHAVVPREKWITATGPKGTCILVDTWGYHKGGYVQQNDRLLYTCMFTSQAAVLRGSYVSHMDPLPDVADPSVRFALGGTL